MRNLLILLFTAGLLEIGTAQPHLANPTIAGFKGIWFELGQKLTHGDKYSGGLGTYTAKHTPTAIYSEEANKTFFLYGGTRSQDERHLLIMISYFDHATQMLARPVVVYDKKGVDDPHDNASIQLDDEGYIWVFVSGRGNNREGYIFKSQKPFEIHSFQEVLHQLMAYPQPQYIPTKGFTYLFTKYTDGRELYMQHSEDGVNWSAIEKMMGFGGHYQVSGQWKNTIAFMSNWHPEGNVDQRTNLYYLASEDMGKSWQTVDGQPVPTPIMEKDHPTLIEDYHARGLNVYLKDLAFNENGYPLLLYITSPTYEPGPTAISREWRIAIWTGEEWDLHKITDALHNYDMGSLYVSAGGELSIIAPVDEGPQKWGTGGEISEWRSVDHGKSWEKVHQLTQNSLNNHAYVRRPKHAHRGFYAFWADGHADTFSPSHLYFANQEGEVYQLPYDMEEDALFARPTKIK